MKIERIWAMPNLWTFTIKPIRELLKEEILGLSCDPFAGRNSPADVTNDLVEKAGSNLDALTFLKSQPNNHYDTVLYDPPYSITQARNYGSKKFSSMKYWADCKTEEREYHWITCRKCEDEVRVPVRQKICFECKKEENRTSENQE